MDMKFNKSVKKACGRPQEARNRKKGLFFAVKLRGCTTLDPIEDTETYPASRVRAYGNGCTTLDPIEDTETV